MDETKFKQGYQGTVVSTTALYSDIPDSSESLKTGYPVMFRGFHQSVQENVELEP
jgi:hypothetical protein